MNPVLGITEHEHALRLLAILYVRNQTAMYIGYMAGARAFADWLLPDAAKKFGRTLPPLYVHGFSAYEIQELCKIWKIDYGYCCNLLLWAREEVDKHASSNPQKTLPF